MSSSRIKDQLIIRELQRDARQSNVALAAKVGISEGAVRRRIERLVHDGHLRFVAIADPAYMGYDLHVMIRIQAEPDKGDQVIDDLAAMSELSYVYNCTGQFNIAVVGYFRNTEELRTFTSDRIGRLPGVVEVRTVIILRVAKRSQTLPIDEELEAVVEGAH